MDLKEWAALLLPAGDHLIGSPSSSIGKTAGTQSASREQEKGVQEVWGGISQCMLERQRCRK